MLMNWVSRNKRIVQPKMKFLPNQKAEPQTRARATAGSDTEWRNSISGRQKNYKQIRDCRILRNKRSYEPFHAVDAGATIWITA